MTPANVWPGTIWELPCDWRTSLLRQIRTVQMAMQVAISGAAGQIAYSFLPLLCRGEIFGPNTSISLRLLDISPSLEALQGVKMELQDCCFNLVTDITITCDPAVAFAQADVAVLIGGFPRQKGMLRKDLINRNVSIFQTQGQAIDKHGSRDIKVLVVANPANTNCLITMLNAPSIPASNFTCLTRLDHERLRSCLVRKVNEKQGTTNAAEAITATDMRKCIIWGNHSSSQYPDCRQAQVQLNGEWQNVEKVIADAVWTRETVVACVQERGAAVIAARKLSSAMSAASAIAAHLRDWCSGSEELVSMGIRSAGNPYGVQEGLVFSFPVRCRGNWMYDIVPDIALEATSLTKTTAELLQEKADADEILKAVPTVSSL